MRSKSQRTLIRGSAIVSLFFLLSACSTRQPSPSATLPPVPAASAQPEAKPSTIMVPATTASRDPFPKAEDKAISAANLARNASTVEDWDLVSSKLQQAIALMKTVPASSPKYAIAQKNLATYQQQLKMAQQRHRTIATASTPKASAPQEGKPSLAVATAGAPALSGGGSLTGANFSRIELGMSPDEVRSLLGLPTREEGTPPTFSWVWDSADKKTMVSIEFYNNKVSGKTCVTSSSTMKCVSKA
ncbi:MAG: hypothetical protein KME45_08075 [Stenomitos rutilans HA7619-LM2]|nr:hypothetical protein [Stenomitos rutilans HA7619-LM2]